MSSFEMSSKIIQSFANSSNFADIEFFNNSKITSYAEYKKALSDNINTIKCFFELTKVDTERSSLHLNEIDNISKIYKNKKKFIQNDIYDSIFRENEKELIILLDKIKIFESKIDFFVQAKKDLKKFKEAEKELLDNSKYSYKKTDKRVATISNKIKLKKKEISLIKNNLKEDLDNIEKSTEILDNFDNLFNTMDNAALKKYKNNNALSFVAQNNNQNPLNNIKNFLVKKINDEDILFRINLSKSQKYEEIIIFKDSSIVTKKGDLFSSPQIGSENYKNLSQEICEEFIKYTLRKKPFYIDPFIEKIRKENYNLNGAKIAIESLIKHEQILKNYEFNVLETLKERSFEYFDDAISKVKIKHDINTLASSIISAKYKHLYTDKVYEQMKELYELKITKKELQDNIGKKIAGYKNSKDLYEGLQKYINTLQEFDIESTLKKSEKFNVDLSVKEDNYLVLKINDFEASKAFGSASWCISRDSHYFESYSKNNHQFFIFDYSQNSKSNESMIGITLKKDGERKASHLKNDDEFYEDDKNFKKYQMEIISNNKNLFKLSPKMENKLKEYETKNKRIIKNTI